MKKFIIGLFVLFFAATSCFADELRLEKETKYQKKIMEIGFRILNSNQIEKRMTFFYDTNKSVNAVTYSNPKRIVVFKGILPLLDSDDEIAAILSHEISHGLDAHKGFWKRFATEFIPKTYEFQSDKTGVDLMVNAGYNPIAMIIVLNKICEEPNTYENFFTTHPNGLKRVVAVYDYIYAKYPSYLVNNEYKTNIYYQNFLLTTKKERKLIKEKYEAVNSKNVNQKSAK